MVCELLTNILVSFIIQIITNVYLNYKWNKNYSYIYLTIIHVHQLNQIDMNCLWELTFTTKLIKFYGTCDVFMREIGSNINEQNKIT